MSYKNSEGYPDPTAGEAESNIKKQEKKNLKRPESMQEIDNYEQLCRTIRRQVEDSGFHFLSDIWLVCNKTGRLHKGG